MLFVQKAEETSCRLIPHLRCWENNVLVRQLVPSTENCQKCTRQKFTSSHDLFHVWTMNEPEIKFTKRWNEYLEQYRNSARTIDGQEIQFRFHIFLCAKTNEENDEFNSDSFKGTDRMYSAISARHWNKCSLLREIQARILHVRPSIKIMMDLISSANDVHVVFGICDYPFPVEIDVESRKIRFQLLLFQESRRHALCLDLMQLTNSQVMPWQWSKNIIFWESLACRQWGSTADGNLRLPSPRK